MFKRIVIFVFSFILLSPLLAQTIRWSPKGTSFYQTDPSGIIEVDLLKNERKPFLTLEQLENAGAAVEVIELFNFSTDQQKLLIYTNSQRVWRINTRGDYWVYDRQTGKSKKLGSGLPEASLMFAKFSPDGTKVAYVSNYNIYVEDLVSGGITPLTTDGNRKFINGTFDWVYEEEFACRDGFRWSPDSKSIAFWQIDARPTRDFYMINNTDSVYSQVIPVEYPKVGQNPSACKIGIVNISDKQIRWANVQGDPQQHYIVRLEFVPNTNDLLLQQLNRKQNESRIIRCGNGGVDCKTIHTEKDAAWVDVYTPATSDHAYDVDFKHNFDWIAGGKEFLWSSEKSGWRHIYRLSVDGKETQLTKGNFDAIAYKGVDEKNGLVYYAASPTNATQSYLYRTKLNGMGNPELVNPSGLQGTHKYEISPLGTFAVHTFTNVNTKRIREWVALPSHKPVDASRSIEAQLPKARIESNTEFFKVKTADGVEMDGWMTKPVNFDATKKYPVVFFVYTEPWGQLVTDGANVATNYMYAGDMRQDGYIYIALDNRGTPAPKGREWRKSIYRKVGLVNIRDQAMAATEILKWPFVDRDRVAVWGWSGGGSATLNLMFQYPEIYKTGIAIAAVANQLTYDNIYQERYMGLPQENMDDFVKGSPITYAKNLRGNLLYVHGTGDDNVHYANAEMLINELIKHHKAFQLMIYPNRTHSISEGDGTSEHLSALYTSFLQKHCPPGAR